jgi:hypothetical protein
MDEKVEVKKAISELIGCTRRKRRPKTIVEIANLIEFLHQELGTYKDVAEKVGLSTEMLREFRSVRLLDAEVLRLVEKRVIDSVDLVYRISKLDAKTQKAIVYKALENELTGNDVRVVKSSSAGQMSAKKALHRTIKSRNIKTYLIHFRLPKGNTLRYLRSCFSKIVGANEIVSLISEDGIATLSLSYKGQKRLRNAAKQENKTIRKLVENILKQGLGRKNKI